MSTINISVKLFEEVVDRELSNEYYECKSTGNDEEVNMNNLKGKKTMTTVQIGCKIRVLNDSGSAGVYSVGDEGIVTRKDADGDYWVDFGDKYEGCVGSDQEVGDLFEVIEEAPHG